MDKKKYISKLSDNISKEKIVNYTVRLCEQETVNPPGNEYLCTPILKEYFNEIGVDKIEIFEKEEGRTNIVARIKGKEEGPTVAVVGHVDVVPIRGQNWSTNPFGGKVDGDKIISRGAVDNKGPFVSVLEAVRVFRKIIGNDFKGEILIISAADEEKGSEAGIRYLFEELGIKCDYALIPDGGEFSELVYGEMGNLTIEVNSKGKAYHGSVPEKGVNAITPIASLISKLDNYSWEELKGEEDFDGTVLNIALINGGTATNVVPDKVSLTLQWRYPLGVSIEQIEDILKKKLKEVQKAYKDSSIDYDIVNSAIAHSSGKDGKLIEVCKNSAIELGYTSPTPVTIRGATVGKHINAACGAEVVVNGPEDGSMDQMHQPDEYVSITGLTKFAKYYSVILFNLLY